MMKAASVASLIVAHLKTRRIILAYGFLGALHLLVALGSTGSEWVYGHHGWAGARRSLNAKNYLRYGYVESRLAPLDNLGAMKTKQGKPVPRKTYWHHPAGLSLLLSAVFAVFGESPAAARLSVTLLAMLSFVMLALIFRKILGDGPTMLGLLILTFIPLYGAYINFVNYEPLVILCTVLLVFLYERYRERRTWWMVLLIGLAVFAGTFSEYPIYPFYFFFWIVLCTVELRERPRRWALPVLLPVFVLAAGALLLVSFKIMNAWTWEQVYDSFERLFLHRHSLKTETPHMLVLERWDGYWRFFNPVVLALTAYWLLDLGVRAGLRKWSRGDGYILALFFLAFVYWYLLPQAAKIHEYVALYYSLPLAFAAAAGLGQLTSAMSYGSGKVRGFLRAALVALFIVTSVPFLWSIRVFPTYKLTTPVHELDAGNEYDYFVSYNILARFVRDATRPDEMVVFSPGFDIRPELWYYLDRNHRVITERRSMLDAVKRRTHAFFIVNPGKIGVDFLSYLVKHRDFVFSNNYYAFDLGEHLKSITFLKKQLKDQGDLARYFAHLPYPSYTLEEDPWRMVDITLKLRGGAEAKRLLGVIKPKTSGSLSEAVARFNLATADGKTPDPGPILSRLDRKSGLVFADAVELLGSRIERHGGKTRVTFLLRPLHTLDASIVVRMTAVPLHKNESLRKEIGTKTRTLRPVVPSVLWKAGLVYIVEDELALFPGPYRLTFELVQDVTYQVMNDAAGDNLFPFTCSGAAYEEGGPAAPTVTGILGLTAQVPRDLDDVTGALKVMDPSATLKSHPLGDDLVLLGCLSAPSGGGTWTARMFLYNEGLDGRQITMTLSASGPELKAPEKKTLDLGTLEGAKGPGRIFVVEDTFGADPSKLKLTMLLVSPGLPSPLSSSAGTVMPVVEGDVGVRLPLQWLYWYGAIR